MRALGRAVPCSQNRAAFHGAARLSPEEKGKGLQMHVSYHTPARLIRYDGQLDKAGSLAAGLVKDGPLGELVQEAVADPAHELWRYAVVAEDDPDNEAADILRLSLRWPSVSH